MYGSVYEGESVDGMFYVGQGKKWLKRVNDHIKAARRGHKDPLCDALKEDGLNSFEWKNVKDYPTKESCLQGEKDRIKYRRSNNHWFGFNRTKGGNGWGWSNPKEVGKKISQTLKGKKLSKLHRKKISQSHIGIKPTKISKEKSSKTVKNLWKDPEYRKKVLDARKRNPQIPWNKGLKNWQNFVKVIK